MRYFIYTLLLLCHTTLLGQLESMPLLTYANEIVRSEESVEIKNEEEAIYSIKKRITILNAESKANLFYVFYDEENKILKLDADIYDISGEPIRKVRKSEIRDESAVGGGTIYSDSRVRYVELNHSDYPYILEFSYTKRLRGIGYAAFPNWYIQKSSRSSVTLAEFSLTAPKSLDIQYQAYNTDAAPIISEKTDSKTYSWRVTDVPAFKSEPYDPPSHRMLPMVRISPSKFKIDEYSGSMSSWEAYGNFLHQLWEGRDELPDALKQEIATLTADAADEREKISRLYRFMQENKRYVSVQLGIGGWQPFDATYVEEHGYGDCKALSNYMKSMLTEAGIESYPVIINASDSQPYEAEDGFVDPEFNHAILYVPGEDIWLECTSSTKPVGYLGSYCNDRRVLLVTPEGGQLKRTPKLGTAENTARETATVQVRADGAAQLNYQGKLRGILQESWRYYSFYETQEEIENAVREKGKLPSLALGEVQVTSDPNEPLSQLTFSAEATRYASRAGKRLFVPLNLICPLASTPDAVEERQYPIVPGYGYHKEAVIYFELPEGYRVESLPKPQNLDTPYGTYQLTVTEADGQVTLERELKVYDTEHPAEAYEDFRAFFLAVAKADASKMVLVEE